MTIGMAIALIIGGIVGWILMDLCEITTKNKEKEQNINWRENFCTQDGTHD